MIRGYNMTSDNQGRHEIGHWLLTALALDFNQDGQVGRGNPIPSLEGCKKLQTVTLRINGNGNLSSISRRGLESVLTGIVALWRQLVARGVAELEGFAVGANEGVRKRVESEVTSKGNSGYDVWRRNKSMCGGIGIVTTSEVAIVGSDD